MTTSKRLRPPLYPITWTVEDTMTHVDVLTILLSTRSCSIDGCVRSLSIIDARRRRAVLCHRRIITALKTNCEGEDNHRRLHTVFKFKAILVFRCMHLHHPCSRCLRRDSRTPLDENDTYATLILAASQQVVVSLQYKIDGIKINMIARTTIRTDRKSVFLVHSILIQDLNHLIPSETWV